MKTKKISIIYYILFWTLLVSSFIFFASLLILEANGYRLNRQNFSVQKTCLIMLEGTPREVTVKINDENKTVTLPTRFSKLFPGRYEIEITKDGYQSWTKSVVLAGGQAVEYNNIFLISQEPVITKLDLAKYTETRLTNEYNNQSSAFQLKDNEIWYRSKLVTRFADPVYAAVLMRDSNHIIFQVKDEVRIIEIDGTNNNLIYKLKMLDKAIFSVNGSNLTILDHGELVQIDF